MMALLGDISSGNTTLSDWMFLIALIVFAIAFLTQLPSVRPTGDPWWRLLISAGLGLVAVGWLVL
jgi:RsiW-degrading membrane proteinase PrsW (M82 family)